MEDESLKVTGKENNIIKDSPNSSITINVNTEEVLEYIRHLKLLQERAHPSTLNIIVLASVSDFVKNLNEGEDQPDLAPLLPQHGENAGKWKPFGTNRTIEEMMARFQEETGFSLYVHFVHELTLTEEEIMILEERNGKRIIYIVDPLALLNSKNSALSEVIRITTNIGGGIIPMNNNLDGELQHYLTNIYEKKLRNWVYKKYGMLKEACLNVHLNVSGEKLFFRRMSNLAIEYLGISPDEEEPSFVKKFNRVGLDETSSEFRLL